MDTAYHSRMRKLESELKIYETERQKIEANQRIHSAIQRELKEKQRIELSMQLSAVERFQVNSVRRNIELLQRLETLEQQFSQLEIALRVARQQYGGSEALDADSQETGYNLRRVSSLSALPHSRSRSSSMSKRQLPSALTGSYQFQSLFTKEQSSLRSQAFTPLRASSTRLSELQFPVLQSTKVSLPVVPDLSSLATPTWSVSNFLSATSNNFSPSVLPFPGSQSVSLRGSLANIAIASGTVKADLEFQVPQPSFSFSDSTRLLDTPIVTKSTPLKTEVSVSDDFESLFRPAVSVAKNVAAVKQADIAKPEKREELLPAVQRVDLRATANSAKAQVPAPVAVSSSPAKSSAASIASWAVVSPSPAKVATVATSNQATESSDSEEQTDEDSDESEEAPRKAVVPKLNFSEIQSGPEVNLSSRDPPDSAKLSVTDRTRNSETNARRTFAMGVSPRSDDTPLDSSRPREMFEKSSARSQSFFSSESTARTDADEPFALGIRGDLMKSDAYKKMMGTSGGSPQKSVKSPRLDDEDEFESDVISLISGKKSAPNASASASALPVYSTTSNRNAASMSGARINTIADDFFD